MAQTTLLYKTLSITRDSSRNHLRWHVTGTMKDGYVLRYNVQVFGTRKKAKAFIDQCEARDEV